MRWLHLFCFLGFFPVLKPGDQAIKSVIFQLHLTDHAVQKKWQLEGWHKPFNIARGAYTVQRFNSFL